MLEIKLTKGQIALVDDIDADLAEFRWHAIYNPATKSYYAVRSVDRYSKSLSMHRVILSRVLDRELLISEYVDHIFHKTLDNRRSEIRLATGTQNQANRAKTRANTSDYKGVTWNKLRGKWQSKIQCDGRTIHLGWFKEAVDAAIAYNGKAIELFGEFAQLNIGV